MPPLAPEIRGLLLESIEAERLVLICGAGLSMAPPSAIPSAVAVANACFDKHSELGGDLDPALRNDLGGLAEHFMQDGRLRPYFINTLVPWERFVRPSNLGHAALADLLLCRALSAALTTNYDCLVEQCAASFGADFERALDGDDANRTSAKHAPYLKFHGCYTHRVKTVWAASQVQGDEDIRARIESSKTWMAAHLREKDLVFIGFWSDWAYLNSLLDRALTGVQPMSIHIVDPETDAILQTKAPGLWQLVHACGARVQHSTISGAAFLDELRVAFSTVFMRRALKVKQDVFTEASSGARLDDKWLNPAPRDSQLLYALRRDAEGQPRSKPAVLRQPPASCELFGLCNALLMSAGASRIDGEYDFAGRRIRVVNGAGRLIDSLRALFADEPPAVKPPDVIIAAGAQELGVPHNLVRSGVAGDLVRPASGVQWLTLDDARKALGF